MSDKDSDFIDDFYWDDEFERYIKEIEKDLEQSVLEWDYGVDYGKGTVIEIEKCHSGNVKVFTHNGTEFYGGGHLRNSPDTGVDLIIELAHCDYPCSTVNLISLFEIERPAEYIYLPIADMQTPNWSREFWVSLFNDVQRFNKVLVRCMGGHGRTGMVLAIFAGLSGIKYPCRFIREKYCERAIETPKQAEYVRVITECTGRKCPCISCDKLFGRWKYGGKNRTGKKAGSRDSSKAGVSGKSERKR